MKSLATPIGDIGTVAKANVLWSKLFQVFKENIDRQLLSLGKSSSGVVEYCRLYSSTTNPQLLLFKDYVFDRDVFKKFDKGDIFKIKSQSIGITEDPFDFLVCFQHVKSPNISNGLFQPAFPQENLPDSIIIFTNSLLNPSNTVEVQREFKRLEYSYLKNTFVHEYTHLVDNKKSVLKESLVHKDYSKYINSTHEINARYMQLVDNIITMIASIIDEKDFSIRETFPHFTDFFSSVWTDRYTPETLIKYINPENKKRLISRLYALYQFILQEDLNNDINSTRIENFAKQQLNKDDSMKIVSFDEIFNRLQVCYAPTNTGPSISKYDYIKQLINQKKLEFIHAVHLMSKFDKGSPEYNEAYDKYTALGALLHSPAVKGFR